MMRTISRLHQRFLYAIAVVPGLLFMLFLEWQSSDNPWGSRRFTLFDDAMISMDYGRTLAKTGELVWFPGAPRVQGFTNPLWTLWMAFVHLIGFDGSSAALMISLTGILLILASSWIIFDLVLTYSAGNNQLIAVLAAGSLPFLYPMTYWTLRGMEVGALTFFCLLLLRATVNHIRDGRVRISFSMILPMILGITTRFDFVIFCVVAVAALLMWGPPYVKVRLVAQYGVIFVGTAALVCLAQKLYWGSWLPNTYHLKMDGVSPIDRITRGLASSAKTTVLFAIVAVALGCQLRSKELHQRVIVIASAMFVAMAAYAVYIGGDAWEAEMLNRFYATILPLIPLIIGLSFNTVRKRITPVFISLAVLVTSIGAGITVNPYGFSEEHFDIVAVVSILSALIIFLVSFIPRDGYIAGAVLAAVCAIVSAYPVMQQQKNNDLLLTRTNLRITESVETMRDTTEAGASIGTIWAGVPAYYSHRTMLDLLGKNDTFIATSAPHGDFFPGHNKWDYNYSIGKLQPDVIFQTYDRDIEENLHQRIANWGYNKMCPITGTFGSRGYYYRTNSTQIKWNTLKKCV
jgi:arabinofuranosyltransferase